MDKIKFVFGFVIGVTAYCISCIIAEKTMEHLIYKDE
jgi:hypothetical protein